VDLALARPRERVASRVAQQPFAVEEAVGFVDEQRQRPQCLDRAEHARRGDVVCLEWPVAGRAQQVQQRRFAAPLPQRGAGAAENVHARTDWSSGGNRLLNVLWSERRQRPPIFGSATADEANRRAGFHPPGSFLVKPPGWEPSALGGHARICPGTPNNPCPLYVADCSAGDDIGWAARRAVSLVRPFGRRACPVDMAPLFPAPLLRLDGTQGRGMPLIPCTRWPDAESCLAHPRRWQQE
jgi:hypothetical protein